MSEYMSGFNLLVGLSTVVFALGLALISFLAYKKNRRRVILFVCLAFVAYFARSVINLAGTGNSMLTISLSNILDFVTLALIFSAVVKE